MKFEKHVFICANDKPEPKKCCGSAHGMELVNEFNRILTEKGLKPSIRAQRAGCLDACGKGPSLVIYPQGNYYGNVQIEDVAEIIEKELIQNEPLERLKLEFD